MRRKLPLLSLVMVFFFTVSGGAYGLEDLVGASGPGMALLLIVLTPLIWSLPIALMATELTTAIPVEGGYYVWVKKALGPFWGFLEGWWSWLASFAAMAIYPVLFVDYLAMFMAQQFGVQLLADNAFARWVVGMCVIWVSAAINIRGARIVGGSSIVFGVFILAPFLVMSVIGLTNWARNPVPFWEPLTAPDSSVLSAFGLGLFITMWKYAGWDAVSTVNGEIEDPQRNYLRAISITIVMIVLAYLLPIAAGLAAQPDLTAWTTGALPEIAALIGGHALGVWVAIGALVSSIGLFNALLLSISRLPFVLAQDGYLPQVITHVHPKFGTPWVAIIVCSAIYSIFILQAFQTLVVVVVMLYSAALLLEFIALIVFRIRLPAMRRPFRVPGGLVGVIFITLLPAAVLALAIVSQIEFEGVDALYLSIAALLTGPILYPITRRWFKKDQADIPVPIELDPT
jgi:amino acid transporter